MNAKRVLILGFIILLSGIVLAEDANVVRMEVSLHITKAAMESTAVELYEGAPQDYFDGYDEPYNAKVYSVKNELLSNFSFPKSFWVFSDPGGGYDIDEYDTAISFLYYNNVNRVEVWDGMMKMLDLDLSAYTTCNENSICDPTESGITCAVDCRAKVPVAKEEAPGEGMPADVSKEEAVQPSAGGKGIWALVGVAAVVLVMIVIWLASGKKKQKR